MADEERPDWGWKDITEYVASISAEPSIAGSDSVLLYVGPRATWREGREYIERTQTLVDALDLLNPDRPSPGCACIGPPCCVQWYRNALRLKRAAHIAIKLVQDYSEIIR